MTSFPRLFPILALVVGCGASPSQPASPSSDESTTSIPAEPPSPVVDVAEPAPAAAAPWTIDEPVVLDAPSFSMAAAIPSSTDARALADFRPRLRAFGNRTQLRRFANRQRTRRAALDMLVPRLSSMSAGGGGSDMLSGLGAAPSAARAPAPTASSTGVTTTQIAGIDEGDIVKAMGEHFLVLRQGVLYTIQLGDALAVIDRVSVIPEDQDGWIDELLVHVGTRRAVVVGFVEADESTYTVLHLFNIDEEGAIERGDAIWLRSEDYFDSENYATRLVGDDLVLYSIHTLTTEDTFAPEDFEGLPADEVATMRARNRWDATLPALRNERGRFEPTWAPRRIFVRTGHLARTLQAVTRCDLSRTPVPCTTHGVLEDGYARLFVSGTAAYLWVEELNLFGPPGDDASDAAWDAYDARLEEMESTALVYRFPHARSQVSVTAAKGTLASMMHLAELDGHLHALVGWEDDEDGEDDAVGSSAALLSFDLRRFTRALRHSDVRRLPSSTPGAGRFLGGKLVYGASRETVVHDVATNETWISRVGARATRVDPLLGGVLVTVEGEGVEYLTVDLGTSPTIRERRRLSGASGSETRTHGFFFLPSAVGHGTFGVPIVRGASGHSRGQAAIAFFDMAEFRTTLAGELRSEGHEVACLASCVDWYGNARPLFWRGGIYALMGSELVEGTRTEGRIVGSRRVLLDPDPN